MFNQNKKSMIIKPAIHSDIEEILAILKSRLVDVNDPKIFNSELENKGFLIGNVERDELEKLILDQKNNLILVAKEGDEVLGYLIAQRLSEIVDSKKAVVSCLKLHKIDDLQKVIYYRQIATKPQSKNIGSLLLEELLKKAKEIDCEYVVCRIVGEPVNNQKSISFHKKFGFKQIGEDAIGRVKLGVYLYNLYF